MFANSSDDDLMARVALGDSGAFRSLFDRHSPRLLGFCRRFMGATDRGEDMAQDIWVKVVRAAPSYRGENKFGGWLMSIARHVCLDELRKHATKFEVPSEMDDVSSESTIPLEEQIDQQEKVDELKRHIEALPASQRVVLVLSMNEIAYEQIAEELDLTLAAVKSLLFRARQSLQKAMGANL
jgi:RNA polymerase sigma-70 factor (ECF subfamily)